MDSEGAADDDNEQKAEEDLENTKIDELKAQYSQDIDNDFL